MNKERKPLVGDWTKNLFEVDGHYFSHFEEPYINIYGRQKAMRIGGVYNDEGELVRIYASMTEVREYADTTLAYCYSPEEYVTELKKAIREYNGEAT